MTRPQIINMDENEGTKGDNRENTNMKDSAREISTTIENGGMGDLEGKADDNDVNIKKSGKRLNETSRRDDNIPIQIPIVTVENPTPSPHPTLRRQRGMEVDDEEADDAEEDEDDDMDYETGEEEEVEEEEEDTEMTMEEKQAMYSSVKEGDIDAFEDCLDLPNSDINMTWFQENLLMAAIRADQMEMAEFLVDNGLDHTYATSRIVVRETPDGSQKFDRYKVDCRQMAFDRDQEDLVYLLDYLQGRLFSFVPAPKRSPRMRRPPPPPITPTDSNMDEGNNSSDADVSDTSSQQLTQDEHGGEIKNSETKKRKRKKKKGSSSENKTMTSDRGKGQSQSQGQCNEDDDDEVEEKDKTAWTASTFTEVDSGNYSMTSSKLKKSMVEKHNKLLELDLDGTAGADTNNNIGDNGNNNHHHNNKNNNSKPASPRKSLSGAESAEKNSGRSQQDKDSRRQEDGGGGEEGGEGRTDTSRSKTTSYLTSLDLGPPLPEIPHPPDDPIRFNRSQLAVQKSISLRRFYTSPLNESNIASPLQWKKVYTNGSYVKESKHWHVDNNADNERCASYGMLSISNGIDAPSRSPSLRVVSTAPSSLSTPPSRIHSSLPMPSSVVSSSLSSPSSSSSSFSHRPSTISSRISSSSSSTITTNAPTSILKSTSSPSGENRHIRFSADSTTAGKPDKSDKPDKAAVASYMRPTQSTITKQRLHPKFVDSYGGLEFHHVPGRPQIFKLNLKPDKSTDATKSATLSPVINSLTYSIPKTKSSLQRRNYNNISYRV